ncbi:MAG: CoA transferase [Acidimicrobiia bacterium]|nr:CoA transferase [Acidimicrobiia bacterium]
MAGVLEGVRILDLTWGAAGPLGVLLLAEQGADVVKVEPPGGDPFRAYAGYHVWNRSRRSVVLDLKSTAGSDAFHALLDSADVVVESFRPGVTERLGFGYDDIAGQHPRLIYCSCPAYPDGHRNAGRPGYDALVAAASGQQWDQWGWRPGPIFMPMPMPSMGALFLVSIGISAALVAREETGRGQHVRTSLLQGAFLYTTQIWQHVEHDAAAHHSLMAKTSPPGVHQSSVFECAHDEWIHAAAMNGLKPKKTEDQLLGLPDVGDMWTFMALPPEEKRAIEESRAAAYRSRRRDDLVGEFHENDLGAEAIVRPAEMFDHPQLIANGMVATVDDPVLGETTQIGVPFTLEGAPGAIQGPQPKPGAHTREVLTEAGLDEPAIGAVFEATAEAAAAGTATNTGAAGTEG